MLKLIAMRPQDQQDIQGIHRARITARSIWIGSRRQLWAVIADDDPAKEQFERFVREFYEP